MLIQTESHSYVLLVGEDDVEFIACPAYHGSPVIWATLSSALSAGQTLRGRCIWKLKRGFTTEW